MMAAIYGASTIFQTLGSVLCAFASCNAHPGRCGRYPYLYYANEDTGAQLVLGRAGIGSKNHPISFLLGHRIPASGEEVTVRILGESPRHRGHCHSVQ